MISGRLHRRLALLVVVLTLTTSTAGADRRPLVDAGGRTLTGQLLVAAPKLGDPNFARTVIYMVDHDARGAMGLVVNRSYGSGPLQALLKGFGVEAAAASGDVRLHYGGPVDAGRGFILHSSDYSGASTQALHGGVAVSTGLDVLEAMASGNGPRRTLVILGYAGWGPGQLENELARDDWLSAPVDQTLIFDDDVDTIWQRALARAGLNL